MRVNAEPAFSAALDLDWKHWLGCITVYILWLGITCFVKPVHANGCQTRGKGREERERKEEWLSKMEKTKAKGCLKEASLVFNKSKLRPVHTTFWFGSSLNNTWSRNSAPPGSGMCRTASLSFPVSRFVGLRSVFSGRALTWCLLIQLRKTSTQQLLCAVYMSHLNVCTIQQNPCFIQVSNACFFPAQSCYSHLTCMLLPQVC